jgi:hypothetical protein
MMYYFIISFLLSILVCMESGLSIRYNWETYIIAILFGWIVILLILIFQIYEKVSHLLRYIRRAMHWYNIRGIKL